MIMSLQLSLLCAVIYSFVDVSERFLLFPARESTCWHLRFEYVSHLSIGQNVDFLRYDWSFVNRTDET